jgi:uncharacterized protein (TIRG00374 family)
MTRTLRITIQYIFFFGLGIFFAWLSLKSLTRENLLQIEETLVDARHWILVPVFVILFLSHLVRAWRWNLLIDAIGYRPALANTFFAVMIGYLTNQVLPRFGEVLKCTILGRYEKIPADTLIGTVILERLIDALTLFLIILVTLVLQPGLYDQMYQAIFHAKEEPAQGFTIPGWIVTVVIILFLLILLATWMRRRRKKLSDLPGLLLTVWQHIVRGVTSIRSLRRPGLFVVLTMLIWLLYLAGGYLGFLAFRETSIYGVKEAMAILSSGSIGMVISPGGVGAYAFLVQHTMQSYGLNAVTALAFGWVLWAAQALVVVLGGLVSFVAIPYYNKRRLSEPF